MAAKTISISKVLNEIDRPLDEGQPLIFSITWVRMVGDRKGEPKHLEAAQKYVTGSKRSAGSGRKSANQKQQRLLKLQPLDRQGKPQGPPVNVHFPTITKFNGAKVQH